MMEIGSSFLHMHDIISLFAEGESLKMIFISTKKNTESSLFFFIPNLGNVSGFLSTLG